MWIPSDSSLKDHPKLTRLCRDLGIPRVQAIGHLHAFWWWAVLYAPTGALVGFSAIEISEGSLWEGNPDRFLGAMKRAGFIDEDPCAVHDWHDWAGAYQSRRAEDRERKRRERQAKKESETDSKPTPKTSAGRPQDVTRMSCVEDIEDKEGGEEGQGHPRILKNGGPSEREAVVAGLRQNIPPGFSKRYWHTANAGNRWILKDGRKKVWQEELLAWWLKDKAGWREPKEASRPSHAIEVDLQTAPEENEMLRKLLLVELDFARAAERGS